MKFISIESAKGIEIDAPVLVKLTTGDIKLAKLVKQEKTASGTTHTFEVAQFFNEDKPAIEPLLYTTVTHVAKL